MTHQFQREQLEDIFANLIAEECKFQIPVICVQNSTYFVDERDELSVVLSENVHETLEWLLRHDPEAYDALRSCTVFDPMDDGIKNAKRLLAKYFNINPWDILEAVMFEEVDKKSI